MANLTADSIATAGTRYYRTQALISPDRRYAAYSRIQMQIRSNFLQSRVSSILFIENLKTGDFQVVTPTSPLAENPFNASPKETYIGGKIAILIPIAWSAEGDRVLAREFESLLGSDIASDYAVIWDSQLNHTRTVAPTHVHYTHAVLLGWSRRYPDRALFRAGVIGEENWPLWAVDAAGETTAVPDDYPVVFGQTINSVWAGPQAHAE